MSNNTYFISHNGIKSGPFSLNELKTKKLTKKHLVWCAGYDGWQNITDVDELKNIIPVSPPPTPEQRLLQDKIQIIKQNIKPILITQTLLSLLFFALGGGITSPDEIVYQLTQLPYPVYYKSPHDAYINIFIVSFIFAIPFTMITTKLWTSIKKKFNL